MPDPDLEIRGGGGSSIPLDKEGRSPPQNFLALRASFWSKNKRGAPPGSLPWIRRYIMILGSLLLVLIPVWWCMG